MIKTDLGTAMTKLKEGYIVKSIIDEVKYPLCPCQRKYEYYPKQHYVITKEHIMNADWYYNDIKI